eukprot:6038998-Prymnesium_polylepis.1
MALRRAARGSTPRKALRPARPSRAARAGSTVPQRRHRWAPHQVRTRQASRRARRWQLRASTHRAS